MQAIKPSQSEGWNGPKKCCQAMSSLAAGFNTMTNLPTPSHYSTGSSALTKYMVQEIPWNVFSYLAGWEFPHAYVTLFNILQDKEIQEGVSKSFRTGRLERELQMVLLSLGAVVSQSSEFCRNNPLCCFSTSVYYCYCFSVIGSVRKILDTPL
jgi:hypothetical protein